MAKKKRRAGRIVLFAVLILLVLLPAAVFAVTAHLIRSQFGRGDYPDNRYSLMTRFSELEPAYSREMVSFRSGDNQLVGYIYGMERDKGLIIWSHGIGCGHEAYLEQILWLADNGWRVFAYDGTGCGESEGSGSRGLTQSALDLKAALDLTERDLRLAGMPTFLVGHSWGGYAVGAVLNDNYRLRAAVSISGYADPAEMTDAGAEELIGKAGSTLLHPFVWCYNRLLFGRDYGLNAAAGISHTNIPVLVLHGEHDTDVSYDRCSIISKRDQITNPDATFETITGEYADHNSFFVSDEANAYRKEREAAYEALRESRGGSLSDADKEAFRAETDRAMYNQCNEELMTRISSFLTEQLPDLPDASE